MLSLCYALHLLCARYIVLVFSRLIHCCARLLWLESSLVSKCNLEILFEVASWPCHEAPYLGQHRPAQKHLWCFWSWAFFAREVLFLRQLNGPLPRRSCSSIKLMGLCPGGHVPPSKKMGLCPRGHVSPSTNGSLPRRSSPSIMSHFLGSVVSSIFGKFLILVRSCSRHWARIQSAGSLFLIMSRHLLLAVTCLQPWASFFFVKASSFFGMLFLDGKVALDGVRILLAVFWCRHCRFGLRSRLEGLATWQASCHNQLRCWSADLFWCSGDFRGKVYLSCLCSG